MSRTQSLTASWQRSGSLGPVGSDRERLGERVREGTEDRHLDNLVGTALRPCILFPCPFHEQK